jgi:large subunit ribosomal protein L5
VTTTATEKKGPSTEKKGPPRMLQKYREKVVPALQKEFGYRNPMMVPRLSKVVVNMGVGQAVQNKARIDAANKDLTSIVGQKPMIRKARQSVATFKLREGYPIGVAVTLRGARMWEFVDRLVSLAIPRIRDFRGLPTKLDGRGNYTMGLSEQSVFPEIQLDKVEFVQGMDITFVTTARTDKEGMALLASLGMPFRK